MSRSYRNNNPGNIRWGDFAQRHGATKDDGEDYAVFETPLDGLAAFIDLLAHNHREDSIADTMKVYAPTEDANDPKSYAAFIASQVRVPVTTLLRNLDPFQCLNLAKAIVSYEGWRKE